MGDGTNDIKKIPRYNHIPVRPSTFLEFRNLKGDETSDDAFIRKLLKIFKEKLV